LYPFLVTGSNPCRMRRKMSASASAWNLHDKTHTCARETRQDGGELAGPRPVWARAPTVPCSWSVSGEEGVRVHAGASAQAITRAIRHSAERHSAAQPATHGG
jgi:hypothetical protein